MNIVKELRKKKGIQQKELALELGVSIPTISNWEHGKSDPSGERLKKLADFFDVDELVILGHGAIDSKTAFIPTDPKVSGVSETQQIVEYVLNRLGQPAKSEADEASAIRERLRTDPDYKILFDAAEKAPPEHLRAAAAVLKALEQREE